jgi:hypothetical protein
MLRAAERGAQKPVGHVIQASLFGVHDGFVAPGLARDEVTVIEHYR